MERHGAVGEGERSERPAVQPTVVALFEETFDAERALLALRRANHDAERVSLMVRDKAADDHEAGDRATAVARAIVATALEAVGGWLQGLAELIVPERGTYLVAGPMGAALVRISAAGARADASADVSFVAATDFRADFLKWTLTEFGFIPDEATYVEHRLAAGATLVAVTTGEPAALQATRRLFADHDAVYIGMVQTETAFFETAAALLDRTPAVTGNGGVVIADVVARLRRVSEVGAPPEAVALRDRQVVDAQGQEAGVVDDVLVELVDPDGAAGPEPEGPAVRYLVVGFGGVLGLGLGRRRVAVPLPLADVAADPIALRIDKSILLRAPAYDEDTPFSRREEQAISGYFDVPPYWQPGSPLPA